MGEVSDKKVEVCQVDTCVRVTKDGNAICALLGENLQEGQAGFGQTVSEALHNLAHELQRQPVPWGPSATPDTETEGGAVERLCEYAERIAAAQGAGWVADPSTVRKYVAAARAELVGRGDEVVVELREGQLISTCERGVIVHYQGPCRLAIRRLEPAKVEGKVRPVAYPLADRWAYRCPKCTAYTISISSCPGGCPDCKQSWGEPVPLPEGEEGDDG